ncbi:MAG: prolyl oligopeptidase family serine peptidase [Bacteroidota bacterium]
MKYFTAYFFLLPLISSYLFGQVDFAYPKLEESSHEEDYFGKKVKDPYRILEDASSHRTQVWLDEQEGFTTNYRKELPKFQAILGRIQSLGFVRNDVMHKEGKYYFEYMYTHLKQAPSLFYRLSHSAEPTEIVAPNSFRESKGEIPSISGYSLSMDNNFLAVSISKSGSDWQEIRVVKMPSGKILDDHIKWVKFSSIVWKGQGFYYSRYPEPEKGQELTAITVNQKLYYHKLGTPQEEDVFIFETPGVRSFAIQSMPGEKYIIKYGHTERGGKLYKSVSYLITKPGEVKGIFFPLLLLPRDDENIFEVVAVVDNKFYIRTNLNAPNFQILEHEAHAPNKGKIFIGEGDMKLDQVQLIHNEWVCMYLQASNYYGIIYDQKGDIAFKFIMPEGCQVSLQDASINDTETLIFARAFYFPTIVYKLDVLNREINALSSTIIKYDHTKYKTEEVRYKSKDGTEIPMYLTYKKGIDLKDKNRPTLLYGYGGFGITIEPFFDPGVLFLLGNGGIFAVPAIRGGGRFGEEWHKAGMGVKKQNSFDDFIAAAEYLIKNKYTRPDKLAINGGSNGGLLVGAVMTQRPELFQVALPDVGVMDMLRYHKFTTGPHYRREYGCSMFKEEFEVLYKYSPLHNIKRGVNYPATLVFTADHDDRVPPMHSYKFLATLQEKGSQENPYILYLEENSGHSGSSLYQKRYYQQAYMYAFMFHHMGIKPKMLF